MKPKDLDKGKDVPKSSELEKRYWEPGLDSPVLALCTEFGEAFETVVQELAPDDPDSPVHDEAKRVRHVIAEVRVTRAITRCHVDTLKTAVAKASFAWGRAGGEKTIERLVQWLEAIVLAADDPASPAPAYFLIGRIAEAEGAKELKELLVEDRYEFISKKRYERVSEQYLEFTKAMTRLGTGAKKAAHSALSCGERRVRERYYHYVAGSLQMAERAYGDIVCEAERLARIEVPGCIDYLHRFPGAGKHLERCRYWFNQIRLADCCESSASIAFTSLTRWSAALTREVRAFVTAHACVAVGDVPAMCADLDRTVRDFTSRARAGTYAHHVLAGHMDQLHARLADLELCATDLRLDDFPHHIIRRGYGEISRTRLALAGCGCHGGWREAAEALETILGKVGEFERIRRRYLDSGEEDREIPVPEEVVELLCSVLPAARTVWNAISGSWQGRSGDWHTHRVPYDSPQAPALATPRTPVLTYGELEGYADQVKKLPAAAAQPLQKQVETLRALSANAATLGIDPVQAAAGQRAVADRLRAELLAAQLAQTGAVGRAVRNVPPGRRYVDVSAALAPGTPVHSAAAPEVAFVEVMHAGPGVVQES